MKYKYKATETDWDSDMVDSPSNSKRAKVNPMVNIPVGPEQLKSYSLGDTCEITLKGKIKSLESNKRHSRIEIVLDESSIIVPKTSKAISEMLEED